MSECEKYFHFHHHSLYDILASMSTELVRLLQEVAGHLGLAVYRDEHDDRWKDEAKVLISRIRKVLDELPAQ